MESVLINFAIAFLLTVIIGIIALPVLKKINVGRHEREDGPEAHLNKKSTPIMRPE